MMKTFLFMLVFAGFSFPTIAQAQAQCFATVSIPEGDAILLVAGEKLSLTNVTQRFAIGHVLSNIEQSFSVKFVDGTFFPFQADLNFSNNSVSLNLDAFNQYPPRYSVTSTREEFMNDNVLVLQATVSDDETLHSVLVSLACQPG